MIYSPLAIFNPMLRDAPAPIFCELFKRRIRESLAAKDCSSFNVSSAELSSIMMTSISYNDCDKMELSVSDIYSAASCTGITTETSALEDLSDI